MARDTGRHHHHHHHHSSSAHEKHDHRPRRRRTTTEAAATTSHTQADAPDLTGLRRARTAYYTDSAGQNRPPRTSTKTTTATTARMAQDAEPRLRRTSRWHGGSSLGHGSKRHGSEKHSSSRRQDDADDNVVYVYRERDSRGHGRNAREGTASRQPSVSARQSVRPSRSATQRTSRTAAASPEAPQRRTESVRHARRPSRAEPVREPVVASSASVRQAEAPKVSRSASVRTSSRPVMMTRPSLRRSNTVKARSPERVDSAHGSPDQAPSVAVKTTTSTSPSKERRASGLMGLFRHVPAPAPAPEKKYDCIICMDEVSASRCPKLACGHNMCHSCIKRQFVLSVKDPQHMPPTCCSSAHIPLKHVERLLDTKFKIIWNKKYQEYTTKNRIYCPTKGCGEWIKPSHMHMDPSVGRKYGKCVRCKTKVCVLCNAKWHGNKECPKDEETQRFADMAKQAGWQRCYNCKAMVELKEGCNHMTCRCTAQFCMLCGLQWKTCECPWFNYANVDDGDRIFEMRVPQARNIILEAFNAARRPAAAVLRGQDPEDIIIAPFPDAYPAPPVRRNHLVYQNDLRTGLRARTPQPPPAAPAPAPAEDDEDERLARRLQRQLLVDTANEAMARRRRSRAHQPPPPPPREHSPEIEVEVLGIGNAAGHHMNDFAVPAQPARPRRARARARERERGHARAAASAAGGSGGESGSGAAAARAPAPAPAPAPAAPAAPEAEASVMAGLFEGDGSGRRTGPGNNRVGAWLSWVQDDPAEVEGRNQWRRRRSSGGQ
ncbi:uncharacterized protein K452DRAFT_55978 [Aplosporella prunicola CBS 121167]|uniref:RBR-type E3 ubiquitin transferase n=1 Tax=Aplosporella prunicola CBS 121167 TaxID=1176127 RepID=A0A6A6AT71_9PEZI|nr:uncharacterized protein K452DRAFT_55978 [Aplosporella prunicola CBS 121167]KAF2135159.1 hypothetical protein K452DRAFT_55978 [Aplosporella prunicola CBS 121167]